MCDLGIATPFGNIAFVTRPVLDAETLKVTTRLRDFYSEATTGGPFLVFSPWRTADWRETGFIASVILP